MSPDFFPTADGSEHHRTLAGQIFKAQRTASRRLCMQFLYALDAKNAAMQALQTQLDELPARIAEAKADESVAEHTPPPLDEEGNPLPVVKAAVPLSEQLLAQQQALESFLADEPTAAPTFAEDALEAFFELASELWADATQEATSEGTPADPTDLAAHANRRILRKGWSRTRKLAAFAVEHAKEIDQWISRAAVNWRIDRMDRVDRAILRTATAELLFDPAVHHAIIINEAVEMAKDYGQKDSWRFVNGVLDQIRKGVAAAPLVLDGSLNN